MATVGEVVPTVGLTFAVCQDQRRVEILRTVPVPWLL